MLKNEARRGGFAGAESYNGTPENRRVPRRPTPRSEVVLEVLRNFFRQRSFRALLGAFRAQDHDRSGRFELPEFALALKALNLDLEDDDIAAVFASLDADGSGVLELSEFMNAMLAEPSADEARWLPPWDRQAAAAARPGRAFDPENGARGDVLHARTRRLS